MDRVIIVGAGLYGLITAKTYLQVAGAYDSRDERDITDSFTGDIPDCFSGTRQTVEETPGCNLLVLDAASDIGGTWAERRLYPNLLSQNSYGLYEFSDLPLSDVVPEEEAGVGSRFIAGWKINKYLHAWIDKWKLRRHIKLSCKVDSIRRLDSKEWKINIRRTTDPGDVFSLICDKLILATGLTSVPNMPDISPEPRTTMETCAPIIHAKDIGDWARAHLGYRPLPDNETKKDLQVPASVDLRSVAIYGGAKSSFDLVHFFATLHRKDPALHLETAPQAPVQVHWIIREKGTGPAWMAPPTSALPNGDVVASDKAASSRFLRYLAPCSYETPKRLFLKGAKNGQSSGLHVEGSWLARLLHGNPLGRWWIRWLWDSVDRNLVDLAQYEKDTKMRLLQPSKSVISCGASIGIANQPDLWEIIRSSQVNVHRSTISNISAPIADNNGTTHATISLEDGSSIKGVDLVVHATGYKPIVPIKFDPPSFRLSLGLSGLLNTSFKMDSDYEKAGTNDSIEIPVDDATRSHLQHWEALDQDIKPRVRQTLSATGCIPLDDSKQSWAGESQLLSYRLFRRMVAPNLVAKGDRSFGTVGVVLTSTIAVVAEVQALWVTAFLTGGFDRCCRSSSTTGSGPLDLGAMSQAAMDRSVSEDVVLGSLTGSGLEVDAIHYNDILMHDLGLNPYRLGGGFMKELTGVYEPSAYAGIVDEWRKSQSGPPSNNR